MRDFAVGAAVLGNLSAAYFYGYAGMQIPVGVLLDRFGPRRLITIAALALRRRLRAFCHRRHAGDRHRRPVPDRRVCRLQSGRCHGRRRPVVQPRPLCHVVGTGDGDRHGRRRARASASAPGGRGHRLAHDHAAACCWRRRALACILGDRSRQVARQRRRWRRAVGTDGGRAPSSDLADCAAGLGTASPLLGFAGLWGVPFSRRPTDCRARRPRP